MKVVGGLVDGDQECQYVRELHAFQAQINGGFFIALRQGLDLRLHARDPLSDLRGRGCFFHEREQREMSVMCGHATFDLRQTIPLGEIVLAQCRQFGEIFLLPHRLPFEASQVVEQGVYDEHEDETQSDDDPSGQQESPFPLGHEMPSFSKVLHHDGFTVTVIRNTT